MHEMSIAEALVEQVLDAARRNNATHISQVELEVGEMRQVVPDALQLAYSEMSRGTPAEGSVLMIEVKPILAVCRRCERMFVAEIDGYQCPQCGAADARIISGHDILLRSVVCEVVDEVVGV